jgi:hypothetical protein
MNEELLRILRDIASQWNQAEAWIKDAELFTGEVPIPAINELRYAGRRLVDLIEVCFIDTNGGSVDLEYAKKILIEVSEIVVRARHDVVDSIFLFAQLYFDEMEKRFSAVQLVAICPDYTRIGVTMQSIATLVVSSRDQRRLRAEQYLQIHSVDIPKIKDAYRIIKGSEARLQKERKRVQRLTWLTVGSFWGTIVSLVAGTYLTIAAYHRIWPF